MTTALKAIWPLWQVAGLPVGALAHLTLTGREPVLPSSFAVGSAAQATLGAAALVAAEVGHKRNGLRQQVRVDTRRAALECLGRFSIDGRTPELWDKLAGLYRCGDGVLRLLGLPTEAPTSCEAVAAALSDRHAFEFDDAAAQAGLVVAAVRSFAEWNAHPHSAAVAELALVAIERIGGSPSLAWSALPRDASPLHGLRVLDLTRILAGPVGGRTLAAYGADVMLVCAPQLPNIGAIIETSRGKRSALADLREPLGRDGLRAVLRDAHVFVQGYRPGALATLGFAAADVAAVRPGIVMLSLSAYGETGPWAGRRGFDSLVQSATGFNVAEAQAAGSPEPKALPMQILDMPTGFLIAFGAQAALLRQQAEGGSWQVRVSLARTAQWLRELGTVEHGFDAPSVDFSGLMETVPSGYGELTAMRQAAEFSHTPARWLRPSVPPGTHPLAWFAV